MHSEWLGQRLMALGTPLKRGLRALVRVEPAQLERW